MKFEVVKLNEEKTYRKPQIKDPEAENTGNFNLSQGWQILASKRKRESWKRTSEMEEEGKRGEVVQ